MVLYNKLSNYVSNHKKWLGFFVVGLIFSSVLLTPLVAHAGFAGFLAEYLILPLAKLIGSLVVTFIGILISVVQYNDFIYSPAVEKGWVITRDLANMFVIVAMMLTAFGTVFKLEEYQWKHILSKLLIMSVLVNFSKMLTGFMIDAGQVVMLTFVNGFKEAAAGNFINGFHLADTFNFANNKGNLSGGGDTDDLFWASVLALISVTISLVVIAVYLVVFIVRIAFLWILVIISPLAYILKVFPGHSEKKYAEEYFDYLGKYITTGPILAFFLWMSLAVMQFSSDAGLTMTVKTGDSMSLADVPNVGITGIGQSDVLLSFMINIAMLIGGLWMTSKLGVVGGGLAKSALSNMEHIGSSIAKAPFKGIAAVGALPLGAAKRWYKERAPAWMQPVAVWKGIQDRSHHLDEEAEGIATARGKEFWTKIVTGNRVRIPYETLAKQANEGKHYKEFAALNKEQKAYVMRGLAKKGGEEGETLRATMMLAAGAEAHVDDVIVDDYFAFEHKWKDSKGRGHQGFAAQVDPNGIAHYDKRGKLTKEQEDQGWGYELHSNQIERDFFKAVLTGHEGARVAYDVGEALKKNGHFQGAEMSHFHNGHMAWHSEEGNIKNALNELSKLPNLRQQQGTQAHTSHVIRMNPRGVKNDKGERGEVVYWAAGNDGSFENRSWDQTYQHKDPLERSRYTTERGAGADFGYNRGKDNQFVVDESIKRDTKMESRWNEDAAGMIAAWVRSGAEGIHYFDDKGEKHDYKDITSMAKDLKWEINPEKVVVPQQLQGLVEYCQKSQTKEPADKAKPAPAAVSNQQTQGSTSAQASTPASVSTPMQQPISPAPAPVQQSTSGETHVNINNQISNVINNAIEATLPGGLGGQDWQGISPQAMRQKEMFRQLFNNIKKEITEVINKQELIGVDVSVLKKKVNSSMDDLEKTLNSQDANIDVSKEFRKFYDEYNNLLG